MFHCDGPHFLLGVAEVLRGHSQRSGTDERPHGENITEADAGHQKKVVGWDGLLQVHCDLRSDPLVGNFAFRIVTVTRRGLPQCQGLNGLLHRMFEELREGMALGRLANILGPSLVVARLTVEGQKIL